MHKTTRDYLGQQYVLWATTYSSAATSDKVGRVHGGYVVKGEFTVVVTKQVLATEADGKGLELIARSESGEEFRNAEGHWYRSDEERTPHVDIVDALKMSDEAHRYGMLAHVDENGHPKVPAGTEFCFLHGCYFLPGDGCEECQRDRSIWVHCHGEGPLHYVPCPFCDQLRSGWRDDDQDSHLGWAHKAELEALGIVRRERHKVRFDQCITEEVPIAS